MVSPSVAGWSLLERLGGILARGMQAGVPAAGEAKKKMDWIDEIRISRCSNDDDDGERKDRRETREDDNKQPASQVTWLQG